MNTTGALLRHGWEVHPSVVIGCVALLVWYFVYFPIRARYAVPFFAGVVVLCLALISPLDPLGDTYLFSAHMLQHLLLILGVPPLLILGLEPARVSGWLQRPGVMRVALVLGRPAIAWTSSMVMMVAWHIPALYNAANANTFVHIFEHLTFLITGCMFWWPIFSPLPSFRISPPGAMAYLFGAAAVCTALGIVITFLPVGYYKPYAHPADELGALHLVRSVWGISAAEDEKLAGLVMWVPGCTVYFIVMLIELGRWYRTPGADKAALFAAGGVNTEVLHG